MCKIDLCFDLFQMVNEMETITDRDWMSIQFSRAQIFIMARCWRKFFVHTEKIGNNLQNCRFKRRRRRRKILRHMSGYNETSNYRKWICSKQKIASHWQQCDIWTSSNPKHHHTLLIPGLFPLRLMLMLQLNVWHFSFLLPLHKLISLLLCRSVLCSEAIFLLILNCLYQSHPYGGCHGEKMCVVW